MAGTAEKYLKPEVIRQVAAAGPAAKFIVEGFISGLHASPFQGFSVEFSEHRKYTAGDNISRHRLERLRQDRPVLHQEVPGRDQPDRLPGDGPLGLDGLHLPPGVDQVRVRHQPGGGPLLPDDPPARSGWPDRVRPEGSPEPGAGEQAVAARQYPVACSPSSSRPGTTMIEPACTRSPA